MPAVQERSPKLDAATLEWIDRFAPYGVIASDRELRVQSWNHWMEIHSGRDFASVAGKSLFDLYPDLAQRRLASHFERALKGEVNVISTALHGYLIPLPPVIRETGFEFMRQTARIAPLTIAEEIVGAIVVIEDVSQREWQAEILRRQHARDQILSWALGHLLKAEDPRRTARDVFMKVAEFLEFDTYCLLSFDRETNSFRLTSSGGISPEQESLLQVVPADKVPWLPDVGEGHTLVREHVQSSNDPHLALSRQLGFRAYVVLPLITGKTVLGMLCFATRTRETIASTELDLFSAIGQYLAVALNREKTDRDLRDAQHKLSEHAQDLEQKVTDRTASLKQIIAELQTFSYTIAHDLRAPIRALKGYCEVLIEDYSDNLPSDAKIIIHKLRNSSLQMDALTRDLLEFSKVSRQDITLAPVDLKEIVTETIALVGPAASSCVKVSGHLHTVIANRTLVGQCVSNLIENAIKFCKGSQAPSVKIWSEIFANSFKSEADNTQFFTRSRYNEPEQHRSQDDAPRVRLWIEDKGIGISPEAQKKIFGIFERGDSAGQYDGTGIGLAIVARAMERMGGNCGVISTAGEGSRFWLEFRTTQ